MHPIPLGGWLTVGGLAIGGLALPMVSAPLHAQETPSAQALIDRIRQIQGEIETSRPDPASSQDTGTEVAANPEIGEDAMRAIVRESLGVEILRIEVVEQDGQPAYAVTVMNPPGDQNDAFRVATLLFDGTTGALLGQESSAPQAAAPDLPTATAPGGSESIGPEIRRRTLR